MSIKMTVHITHTAPKMILLTAMIVFLLTSSAVAGGAPEASEIIRIEWKWQQTLYNNDTEVVPDDPDRYTVTFDPDGKIHLRPYYPRHVPAGFTGTDVYQKPECGPHLFSATGQSVSRFKI